MHVFYFLLLPDSVISSGFALVKPAPSCRSKMSSDGRISPREAIKDWLASAVDSADVDQDDLGRTKRRGDAHRHSTRPRRREERAKSTVHKTIVPERRHEDSQAGAHLDDLHMRKRRRLRNDAESLLEVALSEDLRDTPRKARQGSEDNRHADTKGDSSDGSLVDRESFMSRTDTARPPPVESFQRRPRHKTHEDRYTTKIDARKRKPAQVKVKRLSNERGRAPKKAGARLMQDYEASNVTQDRLTVCRPCHACRRPLIACIQLRPTQGLGIFGNGKVSSPVKRQPCEYLIKHFTLALLD